MIFTPIGLILLPIALLFLFINKRYLYIMTIFFIPFTATSFVNISSLATGIPLSLCIGGLFLFSQLESQISLYTKRERKRELYKVSVKRIFFYRKYSFLLASFLSIAILSLIMPVLLNGGLKIVCIGVCDEPYLYINLTSKHITQIIYLIYGTLLSLAIYSKNKSKADFFLTIKVYIVSSIFVSTWGLMQWSFFKLNLQYPSEIFNNNINPSAAGFTQTLTNLNSSRISSVSLEPSFMAMSLLAILPILIFAYFGKYTFFSRRFDKYNIAIIVTVLFLSTSSTSYIGLIFFAFLFFLYLIIFKKISPALLLLISTILFVAICLYFYVNEFKLIVDTMMFGKLDSESGRERSLSIQQAITIFFDYPFLGLGWSSVNAYSLIPWLLANTGLIGFSCFSIFNFSILLDGYKQLFCTYRSSTSFSKSFYLICGIQTSFILSIFLSITSGFIYTVGTYWFLIGISISSFSIFTSVDDSSELQSIH